MFPGEICFERKYPLPAISFQGARFEGKANFSKASFGGAADFLEASFKGKADFWKAIFGWEADFSVVSFGGAADLSYASFGGAAAFWSASFGGAANFSYVSFGGAATFWMMRFGGEANFQGASFQQTAIFASITIKSGVQFDFGNCILGPEPIYFRDCPDLRKAKLNFNGVLNVANLHFVNCEWPEEHGRIKVAVEDTRGQLQATRDFYQRMKRKYKDEHNEYEASRWHIAEKEAHLKLMTQRTRSLREVGREALAGLVSDKCRARLQRAVRRVRQGKARRAARVLWRIAGQWARPTFDAVSERMTRHALRAYKLLSGFGEKPVQALCWLLLFVLLPLLPWVFPGHYLYYIPLLREQPTAADGFWGATRLWMLFWQLLITFQAALFGFALRNRFRR